MRDWLKRGNHHLEERNQFLKKEKEKDKKEQTQNRKCYLKLK
jgi:hypothetical protein